MEKVNGGQWMKVTQIHRCELALNKKTLINKILYFKLWASPCDLARNLLWSESNKALSQNKYGVMLYFCTYIINHPINLGGWRAVRQEAFSLLGLFKADRTFPWVQKYGTSKLKFPIKSSICICSFCYFKSCILPSRTSLLTGIQEIG